MKTLFHRARVAFEFRTMKEADLASFADGVAIRLTGNATFPSPPVPAATLSTQVGTLRAALAAIASSGRTKVLTAQSKEARLALLLSLVADGHYVEDTSNTAAAGDSAKAAALVVSAAFALAKTPTGGPKATGVVGTGPGWIHLRDKKDARVEAHLWRYGLTSAKGTPPSTLVTLVTLEVDLIIRDLPSGTTLAVQHAAVGPVGTGAKKATGAGSGLTTLPAALGKHPVHSNLQTQPYTFGDFAYAVVP